MIVESQAVFQGTPASDEDHSTAFQPSGCANGACIQEFNYADIDDSSLSIIEAAIAAKAYLDLSMCRELDKLPPCCPQMSFTVIPHPPCARRTVSAVVEIRKNCGRQPVFSVMGITACFIEYSQE